ncbi:F-box/LRR-repeat protein [Senna tora]|uniref:F-box/LRR-repeat protein n=1 Tax=Senna tora TaxID=362788 RepID=A0A834XFN4_9FABA|nr:F-box/LRR-repeat protein [Senna tora]
MSSRTREINQSKALHGSNSTEMSCLPNELLEHILLFLPLQDAITMSSLSKTWLHVWNSLPIRKFHFDYVKGSDDFALREFVNSVDESLSTLKQRKSFIASFSLSMNLKSQQEGRRMTRSEYDQYLKQKYASCHPKEGGHLG